MISVVVVDDQDLVRAGAVAAVRAQADLSVVGEAGDGAEAVRAVARLHPDVVLMDLRMPVTDGIEATRQIVASLPATRVLVLTTFDADELVYAAMRAGASGFLLKDASVEAIAAGIRAVHHGDPVLAPSVTRQVVRQMLTYAPGPASDDDASLLTARELEIVRLIADGLSNAEISRTVYLAEPTVKAHVGRVLTKLDLRDRVQVAVWAHRRGLAR